MATTNRAVLGAVFLVASALMLPTLGRAPLLDPPEGTHVEIAREMIDGGDWITPHLDGVPYFDKPPLLYWLMAGAFASLGRSAWAARLTSALPAIAVAVLTARLGIRLHSGRVGLLAGLLVVANLELFLFGRLVKPDLLFVLSVLLALSAFVEAYLARSRHALLLFCACLGLIVLAKDFMGAVALLAAVSLLTVLTRDLHDWRRSIPWSGVLLGLVIVVPWHALVEWRHPGFLWYSIVDNHVLNFARRRVFPDEDVPLSALEFVGVTAAGFFPWTLALPSALWRVCAGAHGRGRDRTWLLLALWTVGVLGFFTLSPFKLPHYGLPAFPSMALLVARFWNDVLEGQRGAPSSRAALLPPLLALAVLAGLSFLVWWGIVALPSGILSVADVSTRSASIAGEAPAATLGQMAPLFRTLFIVFALATIAVGGAHVHRNAAIGLGALLACMTAFLPLCAEGFEIFARSRSVAPMAEAIALRAGPDDILVHEGPIENSASWLPSLDRPVKIVGGRRSSLAFGAASAAGRATFWDPGALADAWHGGGRVLLLSVVPPANSVVRDLPAGQVYLLADRGGRWLYSNRR